ncbi:MAG TPA: efflux RND transporter permease subunit [Tepidisphaeraceae bacterium]|nr:efflux RND transporter permease subunit [Tepidisphaeraceae bacterium]
MNLSEPFIRRPVATVVLTISAVVFGALAVIRLPVNDLPSVDYPVIQVNVGYPGASPETVASTIATPLEKQFMQIPGLDLVTSKSSQGFCQLNLQFVLEKNIDAASTDVQAAISRAGGSLPADLPAPPTFVKTNPNDQPIQYIAMTSDSMTQGQLYDLGSTQVQQRISIISGVSQVVIFGARSAIRVKADPSALAARQLTMDDLASAIRQGTSLQGAGQIDGPNRSFLLNPDAQLMNAAGYEELIVGQQNDAPVRLRDVATAVDSVQDERLKMRFWAKGYKVPDATIVLAVYRQAGANAVQVATAVRELLPVVQQQLPASAKLTQIYDRSQSIVNSVVDVSETLFIAFVLVVIVIFLFLGRATDTLIPAVALPLSLLLTFIAMKWLGFSIDNLSLMALTLAIGFLVDDAIVFLENTVRRMQEYDEKPMQAAINSAQEISFTILSMTLSLGAVFIPLVFMSGLVGRIFFEFAVTIIISIMASGVVSLTLTPLMCARLLAARGKDVKKTWVERVIGGIEHHVLRIYGDVLWFFLRFRMASILIWIICLAGTLFFWTRVPKTFLPVGDSSFLFGAMIAQEGASPDLMHTYQERAEAGLHSYEGVRVTFTATGVSQFLGSNQGLMIAFLDDPGKRPPLTTRNPGTGQTATIQDPSIDQVASYLSGNVMANVGGAFAVLNPQPVLQISTGATRNLTGKYSYSISGINPDEVYTATNALMAKLMPKIGTIFDGRIVPDLYVHTPSLKINVLRDQAKTYNVSSSRIETLLKNAYSQNYVYLIKSNQDQYQVILEVNDKSKNHPEDLGLLYIRSDDGKNVVPLSAIATWEPTIGPQVVNHINQFTSVTLTFNLLPGVPLEEATNFIEQASHESVPPYLRAQFQGEAFDFQQTMSSLVVLMILAVFVMYVILAILYESYLHPITVLSTLPTAMVGGLATLWVFRTLGMPGIELSLYAYIGLFMLMGIVKKNGIMIVDFAIQRVAEGETAEQAIHDASMDRFRPIMMTTMAALMGAVPVAIGWGADAVSRRPLGLVIVGGLIVSQLITLFVTPVIYLYMELFQEKVLNRIPFFAAHYEGHAMHHEHGHSAPIPDARLAHVPAGDGNGQ